MQLPQNLNTCHVSANSPALRFKTSDGSAQPAWIERRLQDVADIFLGLTYTPAYVPEGIPFLSGQNLKNGKIDWSRLHYISPDEFRRYTSSAKPRPGDILFARAGTLGNPVIWEQKKDICVFVSVGFLRIKVPDCLNTFLKVWMESPLFARQVKQKVAGSSQKNLNTGWLKDFTFNCPPLPEQRKITNFFTLLDQRIEVTAQKYRSLNELKHAYAQRIFSGALRFKDDEGDNYPAWQELKLENVCTLSKGTRIQNGSSMTLIDLNFLRTGRLKTTTHGVSIQKGDLIIVADGENSGEIFRAPAAGFLGSTFLRVLLKVQVQPEFCCQLIANWQSRFKRTRIGSSIPHLNKDFFYHQRFGCPSAAEQGKISNFLTDLDHKITLTAKKLDELQQLKQSLLQKMLV